MDALKKWFPDDILEKYEIKNYNHAIEILAQSFNDEFLELLNTLRNLK